MGNSHISNLFAAIGKLDGEQIRKQIKSQLGYNVTKEKAQKLETYLNNIFYNKTPNSKGSQVKQMLESSTTKYLQETFDTTLNKYDFQKNYLSSNKSNAAIEIEGRQSYKHTERIYRQTLQNRYYNALYALEDIQKLSPDQMTTKIEETISKLNAIISEINNLLYSYEFRISKSGAEYLDVNNFNIQKINKIDELWQELTFYDSMPLTPQETGEVFERALTALGKGVDIENLTEEMIQEAFSKENKTFGAAIANRGQLINCTGVEVVIKQNKNSKNKEANIKYKVTGDNGSSYTISGVFSGKQGKMDVEYTMPSIPNTNFKITAKNWASMKNRDFGEADLSDVLLRTAGLNPTLAYGLSYYTKGVPSENVHNFAKMCAVADILIGYSQRENYADTIVINDRTGKIRVYSIPYLISKLDLNNLNIGGYDKNKIWSELHHSVNFDQISNGSSKNYINEIIGALKSFKLTLAASALGIK